MDLLQPILMASIIDQGVMQNDTAHILHTGLIMLGARRRLEVSVVRSILPLPRAFRCRPAPGFVP